MKKCIWILILALLLCGCVGVQEEKEQTELYFLPDSLWIFTGTTAEEMAVSVLELGGDYCTAAQAVEGGLQLELTQTQRDNLIARNNAFVEEIAAELTACSSLYRFEPDPDYRKVVLYFDENIPPVLNARAVMGIPGWYGMNYLLLNGTEAWSVELTVCNCHTGKEVTSMILPDGAGSYGPEEWEESYK